MIDPDTVPLEANLSRADVRLIHRLAQGKRLVEFGSGGSTLLFAQFCEKVISYETEREWFQLVQSTMAERREAGTAYCTTSVRMAPYGLLPKRLPRADVYFIDGRVEHRNQWLRAVLKQKPTRQILLHDSRLRRAVREYGRLISWPSFLSVRSIEPHYDGSNCILVTLRDEPVEYENWNHTELENRLPHLDEVVKT